MGEELADPARLIDMRMQVQIAGRQIVDCRDPLAPQRVDRFAVEVKMNPIAGQIGNIGRMQPDRPAGYDGMKFALAVRELGRQRAVEPLPLRQIAV